MRRWIRLAAKLYPRAWRERYGDEFDALIEDIDPVWRQLMNVMGEGIAMQMKTGALYAKVAAAMAVVGAIAALIIGAQQVRYVSTARLQMTPQHDPNFPVKDDVLVRNAAVKRDEMLGEILSRGSVSEMIQRPSLDLYRGERARIPMEDVIIRMRQDVGVQFLDNGVIEVSFTYPDRDKAQAVVDELVRKFIEGNMAKTASRNEMFERLWRRSGPKGENMTLIRPPSLRDEMASTRPLWIAYGVGAGALFGLVVTAFWRRPGRSVVVAAAGVLGCAAGFGLSTLAPVHYRSDAILRIAPSTDPSHITGEFAPPDTREVVGHLREALLSSGALREMIQPPRLDLYPDLRKRDGIQSAFDRARTHDLHVEMANDSLAGSPWGGGRFLIGFSYPERDKAQIMCRELVSFFMETYRGEHRQRAKGDGIALLVEQYWSGENLEVLDPPSMGRAEPGIGQWGWAIGLGAGLLAGLFFTRRRTTAYSAPPSAVPLPSPPA